MMSLHHNTKLCNFRLNAQYAATLLKTFAMLWMNVLLKVWNDEKWY